MNSIYLRLREHLDSMPNGYPATGSGVEIEILKRIFSEEEAELFMKLKMTFETPQQTSARTGVDIDTLNRLLPQMTLKGQLMGIAIHNLSLYKAMPFIFGIYEFQLTRIDREMALLCEKYGEEAFSEDFFTKTPPLMKAIPIGIEVKDDTKIEPYESVAALIEGAKSWAVRDCICKKEKALLGKRCDKPMEVCLSFAPVEHAFDKDHASRAITKDEAYSILKLAEEAGLVHMTSNVKSGQYYICNCCKCCCGPLSKYISVSKNAAAKSNYIAVVDKGACIACGDCGNRCQAGAITVDEYAVIRDCIGCGLCVSSCPVEAIKMVKREGSDAVQTPENEKDWMAQRARGRGLGDDYKKFF